MQEKSLISYRFGTLMSNMNSEMQQIQVKEKNGRNNHETSVHI